MHWSSKEFLELNDILAGWSGFKAKSTPVQSKRITVGGNQRQHLTRLYHGIIGPANAIQILEHAAKRSNPSRNITRLKLSWSPLAQCRLMRAGGCEDSIRDWI